MAGFNFFYISWDYAQKYTTYFDYAQASQFFGWRTSQPQTFQPQASIPDLSTLDFSRWLGLCNISSGNYKIMVQFQSQLSRPSLANQNTVLPGASQRGEINGWNFECLAETNKVFSLHDFLGLNVSTTHITAMECWQCLPLSVVQLKDKHCRKPHCSNGIVDTLSLSRV